MCPDPTPELWCPWAAKKALTTNFSPVPNARAGLVVHVQAGTGSLFEWFSNPEAEVSAHFWVGVAGQLEQYVSAADVAWAEMAGNESYLSVETEGQPSEALTYPQEGTLAWLMAWCHQQYGIPLELVDHGGKGVTTHAFYPSGDPDPAWGGHPCPGPTRTAQLPKVLEAAKAIARPL